MKLNILAAAVMDAPLSVRYKAANAALSVVQAWRDENPIGPESPPVTGPARTVEVSDRTGRTDPDVP